MHNANPKPFPVPACLCFEDVTQDSQKSFLTVELLSCLWPHWCWAQDFAFAFQCFMLEYWDREDTGRWPFNQSLSPNVSDDPVVMQDLLFELSKMEPNQEHNPWVRISCPSQKLLDRSRWKRASMSAHQRVCRARQMHSQTLVFSLLCLRIVSGRLAHGLFSMSEKGAAAVGGFDIL